MPSRSPSHRWWTTFCLLAVSLSLLFTTTNCQSLETTANDDTDQQQDEDTGPPAFASISGADHHPPLPIEKIRSASFSDGMQGKIVWRIERSRLPWRGSYSFLGKSDTDHPTTLLSVMDAHTGLKVAECQTPVTRTFHTGWREQLDSNFHWHRVSWELDTDALQCNTTADLKKIRSVIQSENSEAFLVRISAAKGPRCIRNLYADDEEMTDCPPKMRLHAFQADHLKCGCPQVLANETGDKTNEDQLKTEQEEPKSEVAIALEEPITTTEEPPVFGNVRRKPLRSQPPETAEELTTGSIEITAPAFPMFQFTSSMEKEVETTQNPDSSSSAAVTSHQQETEQPSTTDNVETTPLMAESNDQTTVASTNSGADSTTDASPQQCDCQNNGTCVESTKGKRECRCVEGFSGKRCERDLCKELGCQNGGKCQVRNGRAVCSCPHGLHGEKCHQIQTTPQQPFCNPKCENGGVCSMSASSGPMCQCPHGFLGSNCNLRDLCTINTTCQSYGPKARCFKEVADLVKYSPQLQDATYSCQCPNGNGYTECNATLSSRSVETFAPSPSTDRIAEESSRSTPTSQVSNEEMSQSIAPFSQSTEIGRGDGEAEFPMHSLGPQIQHIIGTRPDQSSPNASPTPQFPITSLGSTHSTEAASSFSSFSQPAATTIRILPRPTQRPNSQEASPAEFTRLPASSLQPTTPAAHTSTEEFERLTQVVVEASTGSAGTDHVGPKHSMEGNSNGDESETQPEFHTMPPTPIDTSSTITTTLINLKNTTNETIDQLGENAADTRRESGGGGNWTWIIALAVVGVLLVSASIGGVFMARYVRRSRRLHGKYNPAREENAAVPATYALPMTSTSMVNKDERLI